jgi:hypothetical protein
MASATKIICILIRKGKEEKSVSTSSVSILNIFSLPKHRQGELVENAGVQLEAVVLFEYGKEDGL